THGLDPNVRLKHSGVEWLGDVPEHWKVLPLGRTISLATGFPFQSNGFSAALEDVRLLRGVNVSPGRLRWDDVARWPRAYHDAFRDYSMEVGDIVLGMDRPIVGDGIRVASVSEVDVPSLLLQRVARIRPREGLRPAFAMFLLSGRSFANYIEPIFTGISVPHLSPEQIKSYRIALPSLQEQDEISDHVSLASRSIQLKMDLARRQIELIQEYRTRLVEDVVTGKLDVREAAVQLPDEADDQDL
ncbi:MAG: restriction endonuclease subunit S, partial [Dehalococcoidia bacterium]|nr:restriction endonuclease subunit S [Dehalococcoidia bacterium]